MTTSTVSTRSSEELQPSGLDHLLHPQVIAVVGASRDPAKWGRRVLEYTARAGFRGRLYGVNPRVADLGIDGVMTTPGLGDICEPIDLAVLARPAAWTADLVRECAEQGVRSVLIATAGLGELGGAHLEVQSQFVRLASAAGMRVLGPNTFGIFMAADGINLTPREHIPAGSVSILSQSGNVVVGLYEQARQVGIGFSACVGVGNQADVELGELLEYFAAESTASAIGVYVEGLRGSGISFRTGLAACRAAGKPVVVLKAGQCGHAASAVATHTGVLASDGRLWRAVLAEAGAIQVDSTQDLVDTLAVAGSIGRHGGRAAVVTDGGGDSILAIDALVGHGLSLATLSTDTTARLGELIPEAAPRVASCNPVTLDTPGGVEDDPVILARCARLAASDPGVDLVVVGGLLGGYPRLLERELTCAAELAELHCSGHPVVVQSAFAVADPEPLRLLKGAGVTVLPTIDRLAKALSATLQPTDSGASPRPDGEDMARLTALPILEIVRLLRRSGITVPAMTMAATPFELAAAAEAISYPACVKIASSRIPHKSDVGGVRLELADAAEVQAAAAELWSRFPGCPLLVMPSLPSGPGFPVGTGNDPLFGPFVMVGRGGIWAESDADVAVLMAPVDERAARAAMLSLRCAPTFTGSRGRPAVDLAALGSLIVAMSGLAVAYPELNIEANPVIAYPIGYAIADLRGALTAARHAIR